ncbi:MAG: hypothetical protein EZS28_019273 [Streblomastix strix]|uniref:Uncharacterized protein n=1 Tax=Streblomastix strix TaxID=222440 RepID=A0A5J4VS04_9EUKA|nr:MAG: hypothetical protein EZS28_019273 [Streblomastix strix]
MEDWQDVEYAMDSNVLNSVVIDFRNYLAEEAKDDALFSCRAQEINNENFKEKIDQQKNSKHRIYQSKEKINKQQKIASNKIHSNHLSPRLNSENVDDKGEDIDENSDYHNNSGKFLDENDEIGKQIKRKSKKMVKGIQIQNENQDSTNSIAVEEEQDTIEEDAISNCSLASLVYLQRQYDRKIEEERDEEEDDQLIKELEQSMSLNRV